MFHVVLYPRVLMECKCLCHARALLAVSNCVYSVVHDVCPSPHDTTIQEQLSPDIYLVVDTSSVTLLFPYLQLAQHAHGNIKPGKFCPIKKPWMEWSVDI